MEIHSFKLPQFQLHLNRPDQDKITDISCISGVHISSAAIQALYVSGILTPVTNAMAPITVTWLGLPVVAGLVLIFGVVRKEFVLLILVTLFGTNLAPFFTPLQFIILALVSMLFIPCIATITVLQKNLMESHHNHGFS